jgi:uncharacterized membrane protein AbrB (regulator of aidB expression)
LNKSTFYFAVPLVIALSLASVIFIYVLIYPPFHERTVASSGGAYVLHEVHFDLDTICWILAGLLIACICFSMSIQELDTPEKEDKRALYDLKPEIIG